MIIKCSGMRVRHSIRMTNSTVGDSAEVSAQDVSAQKPMDKCFASRPESTPSKEVKT